MASYYHSLSKTRFFQVAKPYYLSKDIDVRKIACIIIFRFWAPSVVYICNSIVRYGYKIIVS